MNHAYSRLGVNSVRATWGKFILCENVHIMLGSWRNIAEILIYALNFAGMGGMDEMEGFIQFVAKFCCSWFIGQMGKTVSSEVKGLRGRNS